MATYRLMTLASIIMKRFKRPIMANINSSLDPLQSTYCATGPHQIHSLTLCSFLLSWLLHSLSAHTQVVKCCSNSIYKFANATTTIVRRISDNDETQYRQEIEGFEAWCQRPSLNVSKIKEPIIDLFTHPTEARMDSRFKFLDVNISNNLSWSNAIDTMAKKSQQRLYLFRRLRKFGMSPRTLTNFYSCNAKSILGCITAQYGNFSDQDRKKLQRVVNAAQYITQPRGQQPTKSKSHWAENTNA